MTTTPHSKKVILVDAWNTLTTKDGIDNTIRTMLDRFPNRKIILTNANPEERVTCNIVDMPYEVFSLEHKPNKSDPEYYRIMLRRFNLDSADVVYFENDAEAVASARTAGITTHHFDKDIRNSNAVEAFLRENL